MKSLKRFCIVGCLAFVAGCAGTNDINIVQSFEGEHVLATAEFGEENRCFVSSVAMADSTISTRIDFERTPSSVVITDSRSEKEIVRWSGVKTFAWQHRPLGNGRTMRMTITVTTPDEHLLSSFVPTSTTETWLAVLVNDHPVDLDEFLDGCASSDEGDRDERPVTRRRPVSDDEDSEDEERTARRPSRRNNDEDRRRVGPGGLGVRRRRRPEPEVPTTRRDLRDEEVEEESLAAAPALTLE